MEGLRLFVAGGQQYYGPTAERDKNVVALTAQRLFEAIGDTIEVVTGGMSGIPEDFAIAWKQAGGTHILCVVSSEHETTFLERNTHNFKHVVIGESQEKRRIAVTQLPGIKCAFVVQGGKYTTHEMQLLTQRGDVPIVSHWGSGGAAGGTQPYDGWVFQQKPDNLTITSDDPLESPEAISDALVEKIKFHFHP